MGAMLSSTADGSVRVTPVESGFIRSPRTSSDSPVTLLVEASEDADSNSSDGGEVFEWAGGSDQLHDIVAGLVLRAATKASSLQMPRWWIGYPTQAATLSCWLPPASGVSERTDHEPSSLAEKLSWRRFLNAATAPRQITDLLRGFGRNTIADRIDYLRGLHHDDPDEPQLEFESLRTLANLVLSEGQLPDPEIGLTPRGLTVGQWRMPPDGILAMEFHAHDWIRFAGIGSNPRPSDQRRRISGMLEKHRAMSAIRDFAGSLLR